MKHISLLLSISFLTYKIFAQSPELDQLNAAVIPINSFSNENGYEDLISIIPMLTNKEVVGIGEATHGTKEFFQLKQKISEILIQELSFKLLILETYFADTEEMNHYVLTGEGNPYHALIGMGIGTMYNKQMFDLITWIKDYNEGKIEDNKVHIYGCDMQAPQKNALKLMQLLQSEGINDSDLEENLTWISKRMPLNKLSKDEKDLLQSTVKNLKSFSEKLEAGYYRKKYDMYIRQLEQYVLYNTSGNDNNLRDQFMAENCLAIIELEEGAKTIISSHNQHIAKEPGMDGYIPMGQSLFENLGDEFYSLATGFAMGSFRVVDMKKQEKVNIYFDSPCKNSSDLFFSKCISPNFFLDFRSVSDRGLKDELSKIQSSWNIGERYYNEKRAVRKQNLHNSYDGILFVRKTTPPETLNWDLIEE